LLLAENQIQIRWQHLNRGDNTSPGKQAIDSNGFIDLQAVEFVATSHYITPNVHTPKRMGAHEARALMWKLYDRSQSCPTPPSMPLKKRQDELMRAAMDLRAENFLFAGDEFLRRQPWVRDDGSKKDDCWAALCESSDKFLSDARKHAARRAADAERQRKLDRKMQEEGVAHARKMRWLDYVRTADIPAWDGMPDGDCEIIATVAAEKAATEEPQELADERLEWSLAAFRRWKFHTTDELVAARNEVQVKLAQCAAWAMRFDGEGRRECADRIKGMKKWFAKFDADTIREEMWVLDELYNELDPRPSPDEPFL
jgi:hypothetical protein